jgi:hypothetical protein
MSRMFEAKTTSHAKAVTQTANSKHPQQTAVF